MKVKSESEVVQSCPTLSDLMDCSPPGSSVHEARVLEWVAIAFSGYLSQVLSNLEVTGFRRVLRRGGGLPGAPPTPGLRLAGWAGPKLTVPERGPQGRQPPP